MDALQFNKAVSRHCKESGGDCCKCDLRLYCYLSPSERPDELVILVIDFLHNHIENHGHYTHHSAASFPCIDDMDMSTAVGSDLKMPEEIPSEQTDNEYLKEQFGIYSRYVKSLSICTHVLAIISIISLIIAIVALIV